VVQNEIHQQGVLLMTTEPEAHGGWWSTKSTVVKVLIVVGGFIVALGIIAAFNDGSADDTASDAESASVTSPKNQLVSALDAAMSSVAIPAEWEIEILDQTADTGGFAYSASSDLSSSGTWILISVAPFAGHHEEDFWRFVESFAGEGPTEFAQEPTATSGSGLDGYRYELSGFTCNKTGQQLGGYLAVFFGSEHTYEVFL
jgi:hypothetical protein